MNTRSQIRNLFIATALIISAESGAAIISHAGYTHDDTTNVVVGDGLEWLQWDVTKDWSIQNLLDGDLESTIGSGWSVATDSQMTALFNAFDFGYNFSPEDVNAVGEASQYVSLPFEHDILPVLDVGATFLEMFGQTAEFCDQCAGDPYLSTEAIYGYDDPNLDGKYSRAIVSTDSTYQLDTLSPGAAWLTHSYFYATVNRTSIALVRPVPLPAPIILFVSGLFGLFGLARSRRAHYTVLPN